MGGFGLVQNAVIDQGENLSSAVYVGQARAICVDMPDAWDDAGSPAVLTFQGSSDGVRFLDIYDGQGNEVTVVTAQGQVVLLPALPCLWLKLRSGPGAGPVPQTGGATLAVTVVKLPII